MRRNKASASRGKAAAQGCLSEEELFSPSEEPVDPEVFMALLLEFMQTVQRKMRLSTVKTARLTGLKRQHVRQLLPPKGAKSWPKNGPLPRPSFVTILNWFNGLPLDPATVLFDFIRAVQREGARRRVAWQLCAWLERWIADTCRVTTTVAQVIAVPGWLVKEDALFPIRVVVGRLADDGVINAAESQAAPLSPEAVKKITTDLEKICRNVER